MAETVKIIAVQLWYSCDSERVGIGIGGGGGNDGP